MVPVQVHFGGQKARGSQLFSTTTEKNGDYKNWLMNSVTEKLTTHVFIIFYKQKHKTDYTSIHYFV